METKPQPDEQPQTMYELVGGRRFFYDLVDRFYAGVATDDVLRPMYPRNLTGAKRHLADFLVQYWGGPDTYSQQRGHPRLRMRHMPFPIDSAARDAWLHHMFAALDTGPDLHPVINEAMREYFTMAADHLVNRADPDSTSGSSSGDSGPH